MQSPPPRLSFLSAMRLQGFDQEPWWRQGGCAASCGQAEVGSLHPSIFLNYLPSPQIPGPEGHVRSNL